jgi:hypothetical protein
MRGLGLGLAAVIGVVVGNACLLDLEHEVACGDGWVDDKAGEECDPAVRESYAGKCLTSDGTHDAVCHPTACVLLVSEADCALCGNGVLDDGEECDPDIDPVDGLTGERSCVDLEPAYSDTPYTSGITRRCLADCTWDRKECGFCGNGKVDGEERVWVSELQRDLTSRVEECDGEKLNPANASDVTTAACPPDAGAYHECGATCRLDVGKCCFPRGVGCPGPDDPRCCHEYAHPELTDHCSGRATTDDEGAEPPDAEPEGLETCL